MNELTVSETTKLLRSAGKGDKDAMDRLMPVIYSELQSRASGYMRRERRGHTLQTTALVHEVYLKMVDQDEANWSDRTHFFAMTATCIRRILVDHARGRQAAKRGKDFDRIPLDKVDEPDRETTWGLLDLNEALKRLKKHDDRKARIVELRFFSGLETAEIARLLGVSLGTVERDLRLSRAWLHRELEREEEM